MIEVVCRSEAETKALAEEIGRVLKGGDVIELISDIGGGKTTFVKGLAKGLEIDEVVQSPTFTISRLYRARHNLELHHFDFYRLAEPGIMAAELAESLAQPQAIIAIEWSDIVHAILPQTRLVVHITSLSPDERRLRFDVPKQKEKIYKKLLSFKHHQVIA